MKKTPRRGGRALARIKERKRRVNIGVAKMKAKIKVIGIA